MKHGHRERGVCFAGLAVDWVNAFNAHDLDRVQAHYREDVRLTSPLYHRFLGGRATAQGVEELRRYFRFGLAQHPDLHFTLLEVLSGAASVAVRYRTNIGDRICVKCMQIDEAGRIHDVQCHYRDTASRRRFRLRLT